MIRRPSIPLADRGVETLDRIGSDTAFRLRAAGIRTVADLQRASERSLQLAGCTEFEIHAIRYTLAKIVPNEPKGAA